ncbi:MAG: hypothetical protein Q8L55_03765 [Phycisphaerales bacterium]|nr:hypothetical protein [Phycisphaerales bacterium]
MDNRHPNQSPNDGPADQPISRLDELLADRAIGGLGDGEHAELARLLASAGKAEDSSLDLAAAACSAAFNPDDSSVELPASLLAALGREGEAWCGGVHSQDGLAGRIGASSRSARHSAVRTPVVMGRRFSREYGGWLAAAACLVFGVYSWNTRDMGDDSQMGPPRPAIMNASADLTPKFLARPFELAADRLDRWFNESKGPNIQVVPLGSAVPDAGTDVAVGQVMWNPEDGSGVLQINGLEDARMSAKRTYRVSVRCSKSGKQVTVETGSVTLHPGQTEVVVAINPPVMVHGAAAFVVSVCSQGLMGVSQSEGVIGIGGVLGEGASQPEPHESW